MHPCDVQHHASLRLHICIYKVPQPLDLHEIKLAYIIRTAHELTWRCEATHWDAPEHG